VKPSQLIPGQLTANIELLIVEFILLLCDCKEVTQSFYKSIHYFSLIQMIICDFDS